MKQSNACMTYKCVTCIANQGGYCKILTSTKHTEIPQHCGFWMTKEMKERDEEHLRKRIREGYVTPEQVERYGY